MNLVSSFLRIGGAELRRLCALPCDTGDPRVRSMALVRVAGLVTSIGLDSTEELVEESDILSFGTLFLMTADKSGSALDPRSVITDEAHSLGVGGATERSPV